MKKIWKGIWRALWLEKKYILAREQQYQPAVEQYPDVISSRLASDLFPKTKGFLKNDLSKCTGCGDCISACPVTALAMNASVQADGSMKVSQFGIDLGRCFTCGICVEICPVQSITNSADYEGAAYSKAELVHEVWLDRRQVSRREKITEELRKIRSYEVRR